MIRSGWLAACAGALIAAGAHAAPNVTLRTTVNLSVGDAQQQTCGAAEWIAVAPGTEVASATGSRTPATSTSPDTIWWTA
jgi:hypothetical protein